MKAKVEVKSKLKNQQALLIVKSGVKAGPPIRVVPTDD
jgi:hypothetical protein